MYSVYAFCGTCMAYDTEEFSLNMLKKKVQMLDKYNLHTASSLPSLQSETPSQTKPLSTQNFLSWHSNSVVGSAQTENEKKKKKILYRRIRRHK